MKKKIFLIILIIIIIVGSFMIGRQVGLNSEDDKTQIITKEETVSNRDIKKTLTASGSVESKTMEKLELTTTKYFKAMCVENDDTVSKDKNILEYTDGTFLIAPYDCVITNCNVPEAEGRCTSSNYIEISNLDSLITTITINENEINEVSVGQEVEISLTADTSKTYTGKITKLDSVGTYSTSGATFTAVVEFENDDTIKLGMSTSCTIILKEETQVASVPIESISENNNGEQYVTRINEDGSEEEVVVETGIADENYVQILSGLSLNDKVQIETELTESTNNSNNQGMFGSFGGEMNGGQRGFRENGERSNGDMQPPADRGEMKQPQSGTTTP